MLLFAGDRPVLPVVLRQPRGATARIAAAWVDLHEDRPLGAQSLGRGCRRRWRRTRQAFLYLSQHGSATCAEASPHCPDLSAQRRVPEGIRKLAWFGGTTARAVLTMLPDLRVLLAVGFGERG